MVDYIDDKQDKPQIDLKVVELNGDQLRVSGDPNLSTAENTIMMSSINCSLEELKKMPRPLKSGISFLNKNDLTPVYPVTPEFRKKIEAFNKQFGYEVLSASGSIENEIAYVLSGNYEYYDQGGLYSEGSFDKSKYSDPTESKKIEFYVKELEKGSLNEILKLYQQGKLSIIDYETANQKNALNPQTIVTISGPVTTADFQYPLEDNRKQPYAKLILGLDQTCKITDIKAQNKNFIALVQSSNVTGDGISVIKKKLEFYAKNKPVNDPNAENETDNSWENNLNQQ